MTTTSKPARARPRLRLLSNPWGSHRWTVPVEDLEQFGQWLLDQGYQPTRYRHANGDQVTLSREGVIDAILGARSMLDQLAGENVRDGIVPRDPGRRKLWED